MQRGSRLHICTARGRTLNRIATHPIASSRTATLLRRYATTLLLIGLAIVSTVAVAQSVRLRYLEQRHQQMFRDFGTARMELQARLGELAARCPPAAR